MLGIHKVFLCFLPHLGRKSVCQNCLHLKKMRFACSQVFLRRRNTSVFQGEKRSNVRKRHILRHKPAYWYAPFSAERFSLTFHFFDFLCAFFFKLAQHSAFLFAHKVIKQHRYYENTDAIFSLVDQILASFGTKVNLNTIKGNINRLYKCHNLNRINFLSNKEKSMEL